MFQDLFVCVCILTKSMIKFSIYFNKTSFYGCPQDITSGWKLFKSVSFYTYHVFRFGISQNIIEMFYLA